jgi:flavodoxin
MDQKEDIRKDSLPVKCLLVLYSYHHKNTEKIANVFAKVLDAQVKTPRQVRPEDLKHAEEFALNLKQTMCGS